MEVVSSCMGASKKRPLGQMGNKIDLAGMNGGMEMEISTPVDAGK